MSITLEEAKSIVEAIPNFIIKGGVARFPKQDGEELAKLLFSCAHISTHKQPDDCYHILAYVLEHKKLPEEYKALHEWLCDFYPALPWYYEGEQCAILWLLENKSTEIDEISSILAQIYKAEGNEDNFDFKSDLLLAFRTIVEQELEDKQGELNELGKIPPGIGI